MTIDNTVKIKKECGLSNIGTFCSTFIEVAWWFGKCKAKVILPKPLNYDLSYNDNLFVKK